jgi:proteic killer suppression protein
MVYNGCMDPEFRNANLDRLETDARFTGGYPPEVVTAFRKRMQQIRAALDERDLRGHKSLRFERLDGNRKHQHSMRLNDQWRLIVELVGKGAHKVISIVNIEDYH